MTKTTCLLFIAALLVTAVGCRSKTAGFQVAPDAGDADSDSDTDADSDSDSDADDSDGDWLSDGFEEQIGTDPEDEDSDDDGASDFVEWVAGTDPNDPDSNPWSEGDTYFIEPYEGDPAPDGAPLSIPTDLRRADLFMLMDTTGSMGGAITNLKNDLSTVIIPGVEEMIADPWFGVAGFDDYPVSPYGYGADLPFYLLQRTTPSASDAQTAVNLLTTHGGGDIAEGQVPALWATATGGALGSYLEAQTECEPTESGYPCFRPGALPIVVMITDAPFHNAFDDYSPYATITPEPPTWSEAAAALNEIHAKVLSAWVQSSYTTGPVEAHCQQMAWDTGAVTADDDPVVVPVDMGGTGLGEDVIAALELLTTSVPYKRVEGTGRDDTSDDVDAVEAFLDHIEPNTEGGFEDPLDPGVYCTGGLPTIDDNDDDMPDAFIDVLPGTQVCFDVVPKANTTVQPDDEPQVFRAFAEELADGFTVLESRDVYFIVPPEEPISD